MSFSAVIAGVGGQGTLLASKILAAAALSRGMFVRTSETIGMAQRGGSVSSHIRLDAERLSPVIPTRHANLLLGFELSEAVRHLPRLSKSGAAVVNEGKLVPTNVALKTGRYLEEEYRDTLKKNVNDLLLFNASDSAAQIGSPRSLNVVMLGAACGAGFLPFSKEEMLSALRASVKEKTFAVNERAFLLGFEEAKNKPTQ